MGRIWNDWSWQPDSATLAALRRGVIKMHNFGGQFMSENGKKGSLAWSIVVILDGAKTRPFRRYATLDLAVAAAESEPEMKDVPDYLIIHPKSVMGSLEPAELDSLADLAGVRDDKLTVAQRQELVRQWLGTQAPLHDTLSDAALKTRPPAPTPAVKKSAQPKSEDEMATKKKGKKTAAKRAPAKVAKKAAAPKAKGDGLGREGSVTRFLCEGIIAKQDDEKLIAAARKKFPDKKIGDHYVSWYRRKLKNDGVLKG
jgi:hypothetical protein